jgi:hypothetical protein
MSTARLTWEQVLAWRMRRQHLDPVDGGDATEIVRRLCGVQAQVCSAAELAVSLRQAVTTDPPTGLASALESRAVIRTWAMRGTLHALPADTAPAVLSLLAAGRTWQRPSWQRNFATVAQIDTLVEVVAEVLDDGRPRTREELIAEVVRRTGDAHLGAQLTSGWGAVLKPLAWLGELVQGPPAGQRVTFARPQRWVPGWTPLPDPDEAAPPVIRAYLGAYGPASPGTFADWLLRGATPKATLKRWFADLGADLATVDVEGEPLYARAEDVDDLAGTSPNQTLRLLPNFDQYVLGPGTSDGHALPAAWRDLVSRAAGWISAVVVLGGRIVGTWAANDDGEVDVTPFPDVGKLPAKPLRQEIKRVAALL